MDDNITAKLLMDILVFKNSQYEASKLVSLLTNAYVKRDEVEELTARLDQFSDWLTGNDNIDAATINEVNSLEGQVSALTATVAAQAVTIAAIQAALAGAGSPVMDNTATGAKYPETPQTTGLFYGTGTKAAVNSGTSLAFGNGATAPNVESVAIGYNALTSGVRSTSVGGFTTSAAYAVALGTYSTASNVRGCAIGYDTTVTGVDAFGSGQFSNASGTQSVSMIKSSAATATNAIAIGFSSVANTTGAVCIGASASSAGFTGVVCIGEYATVTANNSLGLGVGGVATAPSMAAATAGLRVRIQGVNYLIPLI